MTKILGPLVVAVMVGLGAGDPAQIPQYKEYAAAIVQAAKILVVNIVSMEGHIPFLNDNRRQYAEIVHVINYIGQNLSSYPYWPYNQVYYEYLNTSAAEGINNPQNVIAEVKHLLDAVHDKIQVVMDLIDNCNDSIPVSICNKNIHDIIKENQPLYGVGDLIFLEAGRAAIELNKNNGKFEEVSKDLNATQYVCTSPDDLRILVAELTHLYKTLNDIPRLFRLAKYN